MEIPPTELWSPHHQHHPHVEVVGNVDSQASHRPSESGSSFSLDPQVMPAYVKSLTAAVVATFSAPLQPSNFKRLRFVSFWVHTEQLCSLPSLHLEGEKKSHGSVGAHLCEDMLMNSYLV